MFFNILAMGEFSIIYENVHMGTKLLDISYYIVHCPIHNMFPFLKVLGNEKTVTSENCLSPKRVAR